MPYPCGYSGTQIPPAKERWRIQPLHSGEMLAQRQGPDGTTASILVSATLAIVSMGPDLQDLI